MEDEANLSTRSNDQQILCFTKNTSTQIAISNSSQSAQPSTINFAPSRENFTLILEELYKRIEENEFNEIIQKIRQKDERFVFSKPPKSPQIKNLKLSKIYVAK